MTVFEEPINAALTHLTEEVVIDTSYSAQNDALLHFIASWFELSENGVFLSKSEYERKSIDMEECPSYEEYSKNWNTNIFLETLLLSRYLNKLNSELRPQVEAVLKQHGMLFPPERQLKIIIRAAYKNATWEFENSTHPNAYGCAVNTNFEIVDDPSSPDYNK